MIAKVRIAPVEKWCELYRNRTNVQPYARPGTEVPIITESMTVDPPFLLLIKHDFGSRWWMLAPEFVAATGRQAHQCWICEHMLEID